MSFLHQFARPALPEPEVPYTYDPVAQLNVMPDGTPAAAHPDVIRALATTVSTAGSKTHFDD